MKYRKEEICSTLLRYFLKDFQFNIIFKDLVVEEFSKLGGRGVLLLYHDGAVSQC